jgi:hypothetical protein
MNGVRRKIEPWGYLGKIKIGIFAPFFWGAQT